MPALQLKKQTPQQTRQHFLLPTSISLAFNRTPMPEADATRDKTLQNQGLQDSSLKVPSTCIDIHQFLSVSIRSSRVCPLVSSLITYIKNCSGMY